MAGTKAGGQNTRQTILERYGEDYFKKIGAIGGKKSRGGGFAANRELASRAGAIGGRKSRRKKKEE